MSAVEPEEAQKTGIVVVVYNVDCKGSTKSYGSRLRQVLPIRFGSIHFCLNDEREYERMHLPIRSLGSDARSRYRKHFGTSIQLCRHHALELAMPLPHTRSHFLTTGTNEDCLEKLAAYGIPRGTLPIQSDGTVLLGEQQKWMNMRRKLDAEKLLERQSSLKIDALQSKPKSAQTSPTIQPLSIESQSKFINPQTVDSLVPSPADILFGRGRKVRDHPGNARFLQLIDHYMANYEKNGRVDKACIAEILVRMIKDAGCRFLKKDQNDAWGEVEDSEARKKVAHAFRNRRKFHGYA
eukprot:scaffold9290_cov107-Cylindrotheca_fusiformis.AAC.8